MSDIRGFVAGSASVTVVATGVGVTLKVDDRLATVEATISAEQCKRLRLILGQAEKEARATAGGAK